MEDGAFMGFRGLSTKADGQWKPATSMGNALVIE
jgi:hypothetical protein